MVYLINFIVMFTKRRITPHVYNRLEKGNMDLSFSAFYVPSPVDEFTYEKVSESGSDDSITLISDIAMLFNQQRLDRCSKDALIQYFDSMARTSSPLSELRSKLSDDQLISIVKSRYIQSPSELIAYSERLVHEFGSGLASLSQHVTPQPSPDPTPGSSPSPATA